MVTSYIDNSGFYYFPAFLQQINGSTVKNCVRCLLPLNLMRAFGVLAKSIRPVTGGRDQGKSDPHLSSYGHVFVSADGSWRGGLLARECSWTCDSGSRFLALHKSLIVSLQQKH
jgi:hypothetical protein